MKAKSSRSALRTLTASSIPVPKLSVRSNQHLSTNSSSVAFTMLYTLLPLLTAASLCLAKTGSHLHSHHGPSAQIDLFAPSSSSSPSTSPPIRSASDANALLSSFLGIEEYEHLRTGLEEQAGQLVLLRNSASKAEERRAETMMLLLERPMWHNEGKEKKKGAYKSGESLSPSGTPVPLVRKGATDVEVCSALARPLSVFPAPSHAAGKIQITSILTHFGRRLLPDLTTAPVHSFKVRKSPSGEDWKLLLDTYAERLQSGSEEAEGQFRDTMIHGDMIVDHAKMLGEESFMSDDVRPLPTRPTRNEDLTCHFVLQVYQPFLSSLATLLISAESDVPRTPVHLAGLAEIAAKFGRHSEQYKKAKEMMDISVQVRQNT